MNEWLRASVRRGGYEEMGYGHEFGPPSAFRVLETVYLSNVCATTTRQPPG